MRYLFLALSLVFVFTACNKTPTNTASRANILRSKKWKLSGGTIMVKLPNGRDTTLQYLPFVPDCYKDDYLAFDSLMYGTVFTGGISCNAADPKSHGFIWQLRNNDVNIDLYNGFNDIFGASDTIQYYHFDTLQQGGSLVLDTIIGTTDTTPGFTKQFLVLDTIRELRFYSDNLGDFDIYGATISGFSESSFTLNFSFKTVYPDSTGAHAGLPFNLPPIYKNDTIHYALIYSSF